MNKLYIGHVIKCDGQSFATLLNLRRTFFPRSFTKFSERSIAPSQPIKAWEEDVLGITRKQRPFGLLLFPGQTDEKFSTNLKEE